jgi:probable rRNA maturation factor
VIQVDVTGPAVPRFPRRQIAAFVRATLRALGPSVPQSRAVGSVSIALVDDRQMRALNSSFRHVRRTTDVLTFPAGAADAEPGGLRPLGDIAVSLEQARRQASSEGHSLRTEIRYLLLHGILHALGYDHETDRGQMNRLELAIRPRVGLR